MGYFVPNVLGDLVTVSDEPLDGGIEYQDEALFVQIMQCPYNYKWINDEIIYRLRPDPYHAWNGVEWVFSQRLMDDARGTIWEKIKDYRQQRQYMGAKITTGGHDYWIHSDEVSRSLHLGLLGAAILHILKTVIGITSLPAFPSGKYWKTMESGPTGQPVFVLLDYVIAMQIFAADMDITSACFTKAEEHRLMMEASSDPLNYDYTTNWPKVFGE